MDDGDSMRTWTGFCDGCLFLMPHRPKLLKAHEIARVGPITAAMLTDVVERVRDSMCL